MPQFKSRAKTPTRARTGRGQRSRRKSHKPLDDRVREVGDALRTSLGQVLAGLPGGPHRPGQLVRMLDLNRDICGRVLAAASSDEPISVLTIVPGPEPLRKLLRAMRRRRDIKAAVIDRAELAVQRFEALINDVAGDRPALDAIIASLQPEARAKFELAAKQMAFKGASLIKGAFADLWLHAAIVIPSPDDDSSCDVAHVFGTCGLRRLRPGVTVKFTYRQFGTPEHPVLTLDRRMPAADSSNSAGGGTDELDEFVGSPPAPLDRQAAAHGAVYALGGGDSAGGGVGPASAVDKLLGELRPRCMSRLAAAKPRNRKSLFVAPSIPVKQLVFDILMHRDAFPGAQPHLMIYDTAVDGMASVNDPARDADLLDLHEHVTVLPVEPARWALAELPRYADLLTSVSSRLGVSLDSFTRGGQAWRCRIQYPMHGSQVCIAFDALSS
jgi:hypothetical protein